MEHSPPSTTPCIRAKGYSDQETTVGVAPMARAFFSKMGRLGMRYFMPFMSAGLVMGNFAKKMRGFFLNS